MGEKAYFIAVPTSAGTGSEVTPFAVITDETTGEEYFTGSPIVTLVGYMHENVKALSRPVYKVLAIFSKDYNESVYRTCTYLSKGQQLDKLRIPNDVVKVVVDVS